MARSVSRPLWAFQHWDRVAPGRRAHCLDHGVELLDRLPDPVAPLVAQPFVKKLQQERPRLSVESIEVKKDRAGRKRFIDTMRRLGAEAVGVPTFVVHEKYVVGFTKGTTDVQVTRMVDEALGNEKADERLAPNNLVCLSACLPVCLSACLPACLARALLRLATPS